MKYKLRLQIIPHRFLAFILMLLVFSGSYLAQDDASPPVPPAYRSQPISKGLEILNQANLAHGGKVLDNLKTLKVTKKLRIDDLFYEEITFVDVDQKKLRIERKSYKEKLRSFKNDLFIKQLNQNRGWFFSLNQMNQIANYKPDELNRFLSLGVLGLRKSKLKEIVIDKVQIDAALELKTLFITINGEKYSWVFDWENRLISESNHLFVDKNDKKQEFFEDFRIVDGVVFPHRSVNVSMSVYKLFSITSIIMSDIVMVEVNPKLTERDWSVPN